MARRVLAITLLLLLAGCSSGVAPGPDSGSSSPTETVTPAPVPNATAARLAPGLTADGVVDARRLLAAHRSVAASHAYRRITRTTLVFPDGERRLLRNETRLYDPESGRAMSVVYRTGRRSGRPSSELRRWSNGSVTVSQRIYAGAVSQRTVRPASGFLVDHGGEIAIRTLAAGNTVSVTERVTNGTTVYVITALPSGEPIIGRDARFVAVITKAGFLRSIRLEANRTVSEEPVLYRAILRYESLDRRVGRPAWVNETIAAAGTRNTTRTPAG